MHLCTFESRIVVRNMSRKTRAIHAHAHDSVGSSETIVERSRQRPTSIVIRTAFGFTIVDRARRPKSRRLLLDTAFTRAFAAPYWHIGCPSTDVE